jgi:hypothetical protein
MFTADLALCASWTLQLAISKRKPGIGIKNKAAKKQSETKEKEKGSSKKRKETLHG